VLRRAVSLVRKVWLFARLNLESSVRPSPFPFWRGENGNGDAEADWPAGDLQWVQEVESTIPKINEPSGTLMIGLFLTGR